jgi:hypothetical protein
MPAEQRLREMLDAFAARVREDIDSRAQDLAAALARVVQDADLAMRAEGERTLAGERQQLEVRVAEERAALAALKDDLHRSIAEERQRLEARLADEQAALAGLRAEARRDQAATLVRLLDAVRRLDAASSLSAILESLAQCTLAEASRVVIFVVNGDVLQSWGHFGFAPGQGAFDVPVHAVAVLTSALSTQQSVVFRVADRDDDPSLPPFMRPPPGHVGLVVPLVVGDQVVAVLYADGVEHRAGPETDASHATWTDEAELIARHARARLESVTSERTVMALTGPA